MSEVTGREERTAKCVCPFCDSELDVDISFCQVCRATILYCEDCHIPLERGQTVCPQCGKPATKRKPSENP